MTERMFWLIIHFIGLGAGLGGGLAFFAVMFAAKDMTAEERAVVMPRITVLSYLGQTGLVLLIISGLFLLFPIWPAYKISGTLHAKLTLVAVLVGLTGWGHMQRAKAKRTGQPLKPPTVPLPMLITLVVIVLAVLTFN